MLQVWVSNETENNPQDREELSFPERIREFADKDTPVEHWQIACGLVAFSTLVVLGPKVGDQYPVEKPVEVVEAILKQWGIKGSVGYIDPGESPFYWLFKNGKLLDGIFKASEEIPLKQFMESLVYNLYSLDLMAEDLNKAERIGNPLGMEAVTYLLEMLKEMDDIEETVEFLRRFVIACDIGVLLLAIVNQFEKKVKVSTDVLPWIANMLENIKQE